MLLILCFLAIGVLQLSLQTSLFMFLPPWLGKPDLLFVLVAFTAYRVDALRGALLVFMMGVMADVYSGSLLGLYPSIYVLVYLFIKVAARYVSLDEAAYQVPLIASSYLLAASAVFVITCVFLPDNLPAWPWGAVLLQLLLLGIMTIPLWSFYGLLLAWCTRERRGVRRLLHRSAFGNRFK